MAGRGAVVRSVEHEHRRAPRAPRRRWPWLLAVLLLLLAGLLSRRGTVLLKSAGFFIEIFPSAPAYPLRWFTGKPVVSLIRYPVGDAEASAYLYRPSGDRPHGALIFYIGVGTEYENQHLVRVSEGFARAGVVVMIPVSEAMSDFQVVPKEEEGAVAAFEYLRRQPFVAPERVGFLGLSVGGAVVAMAAQDARIAGDVRVVDCFGGYYCAFDMLSALVLRRIKVDGEWVEWQPAQEPVRVFRDNLLAKVPESDREPLAALFEGTATTIPPGLTPKGEAAARLLINRDPDRMPDLIAGLPPEWRDYLTAISPATNIAGLRADLLLMHDVDDDIIPYSQSIRFYHEANGAGSRELTLLNVFRHVEPQTDDRLQLGIEGARLYGHVYRLLSRLA